MKWQSLITKKMNALMKKKALVELDSAFASVTFL